MSKRRNALITLLLIVAVLLNTTGIAMAATGAIWTTDSSGEPINDNLFPSKEAVYLNGGPSGGGSGGLPDGNYYCRVLSPSGTVLGQNNDPTVEVVGGKMVHAYQLVAILYTASSNFTVLGYDTTDNSGGAYKVEISMNTNFTDKKSDNFKVAAQQITLGSITVRKFDAGSVGLAGATFELWLGSSIYDTQTLTGTSYTWTGLSAGDYTVVETAPPSGYQLADPASQPVTLTMTDNVVANVTVDFHNSPIIVTPGSITVYKRSNQTEGLIDGATFSLYLDANANGSGEIGELVAGPTGTTGGSLTWSNLMAGTYLVYEVTAPTGYHMDGTNPRTVTLTETDHVVSNGSVTFWNTPMEITPGSITVYKRADLGDGGPLLDGATFSLYLDANANGTGEIGEKVAGPTGTTGGSLTWNNLMAGTYLVYEVTAPTGYYMDGTNPRTVTLTETDYVVSNGSVTFWNTPITITPGSITVIKRSTQTEGRIDGATFSLYLDANANGTGEIGEKVAGPTGTAEGSLTWHNLMAGTYLVYEVTAPAGYNMDGTNPRTVTLVQEENVVSSQDVTFWNSPIQINLGAITVRKYTNTEAPLSGARFALWHGETKLDERTLSGSSYTWNNLAAGQYTVVEVSAPAGWIRATPNSKAVTLVEVEGYVNHVYVDFFNSRRTVDESGSLTVIKLTDEGQPLNGATFALYSGSSKLDERTLTGNTYTWSNLNAGTYTVVETSAPAGWVIRDASKSVTLSQGEDGTVTFYNDPIAKGSITVVKLVRNEADGTTSGLNGVTFALYQPDTDGTLLDQRTLAGNEYTWSNLEPGDYVIVELAAPDRPDGLPFEMADPVPVTVPAGENVRVEVFNSLPLTGTGSITVVKLVLNEADGTTSGLNGVTFALYKPDTNGMLVDQRTLTGNEYTWSNLEPGDYMVVEVAAPNRPDGTPFEMADPSSVTVTVGENVRVEIFNSLPLTGTNYVPQFFAGLSMLGLGLALRRRRVL